MLKRFLFCPHTDVPIVFVPIRFVSPNKSEYFHYEKRRQVGVLKPPYKNPSRLLLLAFHLIVSRIGPKKNSRVIRLHM